MAFAVTAGSGTTISADVYGTAHNVSSGEQTQFVALASGTLGALALVTATNPTFTRLTDATNAQKFGNATALALTTGISAALTTKPGQWSLTHAPAKATQATISQSAGAAGTRHVCTDFTISLAQNNTGSVQTLLAFNLRDGATGAGTILKSITMALPATAGECRVFGMSGLNIVGSSATAMTIESAAAPAAETAASVSMSGYTTTG